MKTRNIVIGVALALVVLLAVGLLLGGWLASGGYYGHGMMGGYGLPLGMPALGGVILMLFFWGVIIGGIALLVVGLTRQDEKPAGPDESALGILRRRYASGEIDRQEFEGIREALLS